MSIEITKLASAIAETLQVYNSDLTEAVKENSKKIAKKYALKLKKQSPKLTGDYSKNWTAKETGKGKYRSVYTIYNKDEYPLTHLLENGHVGRDGKRVQANVHISPVEQEAVEEFMDTVTEAIK